MILTDAELFTVILLLSWTLSLLMIGVIGYNLLIAQKENEELRKENKAKDLVIAKMEIKLGNKS